MTQACIEVSALSAGFSLTPNDIPSLTQLYAWLDNLETASRRIKELTVAKEEAAQAAYYEALEAVNAGAAT
jgi:hypothetical protein